MGIFDFDRAVDSAFSTAFGMTAKALCAVASGTFSAVRSAASSFQANKRIKLTAQASRNNRGVWVSSSVDKETLCLNDDPRFDDTETVTDDTPEPALGYVVGECEFPESMLVSGGTDAERSKALLPFAVKSQENSLPLVVLHNANSELEAMIAYCCKQHELISRRGLYCDIFASLGVSDIVSLIYDTIEEDKPEKGTEPLLRALVNVILAKAAGISVEDMASFPLDTLHDEIDSLFSAGIISKPEHTDWSRYYSAGSVAKDSLRMFLERLRSHFSSTFGEKRQNRSNIMRILKHKGAAVIDIGSSNNELAVKLILNYLLLLDMNGLQFNIIMDNLPFSKFTEFSNLVRGRIYAVSHNDFIASLSLSRSKYSHENNSDELFRDFTHDAGVVAVFRHNSMASCRKWSEYMGTYRKIKTQKEHSSTGGWFSYTPSDSVSEQEYDLPRIKDISISRLPSSVVCVHRSEGIFIGSI